MFNHLMTVKEGIGCIGWVTVVSRLLFLRMISSCPCNNEVGGGTWSQPNRWDFISFHITVKLSLFPSYTHSYSLWQRVLGGEKVWSDASQCWETKGAAWKHQSFLINTNIDIRALKMAPRTWEWVVKMWHQWDLYHSLVPETPSPQLPWSPCAQNAG